jgi:hypothetical protein
MTYEQFRDYRVPSPMGDHSRSPGDVEELRGEGGLLSDYTGDRYTLNDFLDKGSTTPQYDMSHLAGAVLAGMPLRIYRSTDAEDVIWPGAYVTLSRAYAADHGERTVRAGSERKYHVLSAVARPDELVAMNPNEFFYAPRDLRAWYDQQVAKAIRSGHPVPAEVRAAYAAKHGK